MARLRRQTALQSGNFAACGWGRRGGRRSGMKSLTDFSGGKTRAESVRAGLHALAQSEIDGNDWVLILQSIYPKI